MGNTIVYEVDDRKATARDAAERFAEAQGREVEWHDDGTFSFVDGNRTYQVQAKAFGWRVVVDSW